MKRLTVNILLVFVIMNTLSSCAGTADTHLELTLCGSYAVPGMFYADLKGETSDVTILEEDEYGRILFVYSAPNIITQKEENAIVICQQIDRNYVYFYEDICYILQDHDKEAVEALKTRNNWNCPLDYARMSRRANQISFDLFIATDSTLLYGNILDAFSEKLGLETCQVTELQFLDIDSSGQELFWSCTAENGTTQCYLLLVSPACDVIVKEIQAGIFTPEEVSGFKAENGWTYGG